MLIMQDFQDLDDLFAQDRGFPDKQAAQLEYEVRHGMQPAYGAYLEYIVEFSCEGATWVGVADHIRASLNHLASSGTLYGKTASFSYAHGRTDNPLKVMTGPPVPSSYRNITQFNVTDFMGSNEYAKAGEVECQHEPVQMIFTSYCKKCNKTL